VYKSKVSYGSPTSQRIIKPTLNSALSLDIVEQARKQTDDLKLVLKNLETVPGSAKYINRVIAASDCLTSLDEGIDAVEQGTKLVENARPSLIRLVDTVKIMEKTKDIPTLVRISADVLRQLEILAPKIAPASPAVCGTAPKATFESLQKISEILDDVSNDQSLPLSPQERSDVKKSGKTVFAVNGFVKQLRFLFNEFDQFCTADKQYNTEAITAVGSMLGSLSDLFGVLGSFEDAKRIKENAALTNKVVAAINQIGDLGLGDLECDSPGNFRVAANTMDEIAALVEEIGIENLKTQLGIDIDFL